MSGKLLSRIDQASLKARQGDLYEALEICNCLIFEFPNSYEGYQKRSEVFRQMGDYQSAFRDLETVIEYLPDEPAPYFRRGRWKLDLGQYNEAIRDFTTVIDFGSDYFFEAAYFFRALSNYYCRKFEQALSDCEYVSKDYHLGPKYLSKEELIHQIAKARSKINF